MNIQTNSNKPKITLDSDDKKIRVMAATIELVAENGIHATPMSQVSKRAGVAAGTIYHYFPTKEAIIREAYLQLKLGIITAMIDTQQDSDDYATRFINYWLSFYEQLMPEGHLLFLEQCAISPIIDEETNQKVDAAFAPIATFLMDGIAEKQLKALPLPLMTHLIFGSLSSTAKAHINPNLPDLSDEDVRQAAQFCWAGLKFS